MLKKHIYIWSILISITFCGLRFHDEQMLKLHHNQAYIQTGQTLTVHLIPHSHDDVGWLKTVDDYFYGGNMRTQFAGVQYTIDTVVSELTDHPQYKFTIVEIAFLYRWWNQATNRQRQQMKILVGNGQLQFANGGWCMSDEANVYYQDFIDNMVVGLRWLKETLNYVPDVAWHIDPFGHHSSTASLFSQMGFQALFFARIDYQDKQNRLQNKGMQMIWRPQQYTGVKSSYIFTHVNYFHYSPPPNFCFDPNCKDQPIKDDPSLQNFNVDTKSKQLVAYFKSMSNHYRTTNLLHTLGDDFQYTNSHMWYKNIDKLMKYINSRPQFGVKIIYSTPANYIDAIQLEKASYPIKNDDFFPYADNSHSFWTGYFTSRVALKGFVKDFSRFTQTARKHISQLKMSNASLIINNSSQKIEQSIFGLQMALGILQHHDAVAGTAKQKVTDDYVSTSIKAINQFNSLYRQIKAEQIAKQTGEYVNSQQLYVNLFWNQTGVTTGLSNKINAGKTVLVSFYNPGSKANYQIKLKVPPKQLDILSSSNNKITGDVVCTNIKDYNDCQLLFNLDFNQSSNAYVKLVPNPVNSSAKIVAIKELTLIQQIKDFAIGNDAVRIARGNQSFQVTLAGGKQTFKLAYNYYEGSMSGGQHSGAYIFKPVHDIPKQYSTMKKIYYFDAATVAIVIIQGDKTYTKVYFSKRVDYVRKYGFTIQTFIQSIPISDSKGKQVTLDIQTKYNNNKTFYTDSMGLQQQTRVLDYRPTWNYTINQATAGNYYPINSFIKIKDVVTNRTITVLNDRSQGATVMQQGQIQIMIHRRLLVDDSRGVGEPLDQVDFDKQGLRQMVRHYVVFGSQYRQVQKWNDQRILPIFSASNSNNFYIKAIRQAPITVPQAVKLYLRLFKDGSYLLRLHNTNLNVKTAVSIDREWNVEEYTLAGNQLKSEWKKNQYVWNQQSIKVTGARLLLLKFKSIFDDMEEQSFRLDLGKKHNQHLDGEITAIDLLPFQIKTFKIYKK